MSYNPANGVLAVNIDYKDIEKTRIFFHVLYKQEDQGAQSDSINNLIINLLYNWRVQMYQSIKATDPKLAKELKDWL